MIARTSETGKGTAVTESSYGQGEIDELRKLGKLLEERGNRRAFADEPQKALEAAGIDASKIPEGVMKTLSELSYEELEVVSRVREDLLAAGVSREYMVEIF
jgi:hypothetical protein